MTSSPPQQCSHCSKTALFICSLCTASSLAPAMYCSVACQKSDWAMHRLAHAAERQAASSNDSTRIGGESHTQQASSQQQPVQSRNNNIANNHGRLSGFSVAHSASSSVSIAHGNAPSPVLSTVNSTAQLRPQSANPPHQPHNNNSSNSRFAFALPKSFATSATQLDNDTIDDLKYYLSQIYLILKPVVACVFFAIMWVKLLNPPAQYYSGHASTPPPDIYALDYGGVSSLVGQNGAVSNPMREDSAQQQADLLMALKTLGSVVGATVVIFILFYFNCMKILYGVFGLIILGVLGVFGYFISVTFLWLNLLPLDYITFAFFIWNFAAVGIMSVFWSKGPLWLQQSYLVVISSMMAFMLTNSSIPTITTWILLALLAVWDLIAVLCPYGPLRLLIETSKSQNREIPALLYSAGPTTMMAAPAERKEKRLDTGTAGVDVSESDNSTGSRVREGLDNGAKVEEVPMVDFEEQRRIRALLQQQQQQREPQPQSNNQSAVESRRPHEQDDDEEEEQDGGMKLGLGDFVFYSVLASRAALSDWVPTMAVTIGVLTGLNFTIFLLVIWQKALPALPFSIAFGLLFYFTAGLVLVPLVNTMVYMPVVPAYDPQAQAWLTVGQIGGAGMVYL
ncbi:Presenilin-1 [Chytriomyces hyalinus]|nr:Presenilin-1 [Chytriomyces hyalinus]